VKKRIRGPSPPAERKTSVRKEIMAVIQGKELSALGISAIVGIPEKDVYDHLEHIKKTVHKGGNGLIVVAPECRKCGFVFQKRAKLKKPGKCPMCRGESIEDPLFSISNE